VVGEIHVHVDARHRLLADLAAIEDYDRVAMSLTPTLSMAMLRVSRERCMSGMEEGGGAVGGALGREGTPLYPILPSVQAFSSRTTSLKNFSSKRHSLGAHRDSAAWRKRG